MSTYPGGKSGSGVYQTIINQMPPHEIYIEPFLGGGAVMKYKKPARLANIAIDMDADVVHHFANPMRAKAFTALVGDALKILPNYFLGCMPQLPVCHPDDLLIYLDPPYLMSTRRIQDRLIYRYELSDDDHLQLLDMVLQCRCKVMLSGYPSEMYDQALQGWRRLSFYTMTRGGSMAQEVLWMNYPTPWELHDYRYLGKNFRERERIKRKIARWKNRLTLMDASERAALMQAIEQTRYPVPPAVSSISTIGAIGNTPIFDDEGLTRQI
jgi:hypothetical protein